METPKLMLPLLAAGQAQKHVTLNEALYALDSLAQIGVRSSVWSSPPASPAEGDAFIVPEVAYGAWAGKGGRIALFQDQHWQFFTPRLGWAAYVEDSARLLIHDGTQWSGGAQLRANDIVLRVPEDAASIQAALDVLAAYRFVGNARGIVDVAAGTHVLLTPINIGHPDLGQIVIRGRTAPSVIAAGDITGARATDETMLRTRYPVVVEAGSAGAVLMANGGRLEIENIAFIRTGAGGTPSGLSVSHRSRLTLTRVAVLGFSTGISIAQAGQLRLRTANQVLHHSENGLYAYDGSQVTGDGLIAGANAVFQAAVEGGSVLRLSGGALIAGINGLYANEGAVAALSTTLIWGQSSNGVYAQNGSTLSLLSPSIGPVGLYAVANLIGSRAVVTGLTVSGANRTVYSSGGSVCQQYGAHTGSPAFSPAIGAVGNGNAMTL
jgi:hypothetical protein